MKITTQFSIRFNPVLFLFNILSLLTVSWILFNTSTAQAETKQTYTIGVVPQFETRRLHAIWRPILIELEKKTGYHFKLQGSPSIPVFEKEFLSGKFDFAYMNPYHLVWSAETTGYQPLVRDHSKKLHGVLTVRKDSGINDVKDLDKKIIAFPSPNALGASLLMRADLEDIHKIQITPRYVKTHDSVYLNVALKQTDAGGGVEKTLNSQKPEIKDSLKVIYRTRSVAPHPFSAHPRVTEEARLKIQQALLEMGATEHGKQLLSKIPIKQIGPATIDDYTPLKNMGLKRFRQED